MKLWNSRFGIGFWIRWARLSIVPYENNSIYPASDPSWPNLLSWLSKSRYSTNCWTNGDFDLPKRSKNTWRRMEWRATSRSKSFQWARLPALPRRRRMCHHHHHLLHQKVNDQNIAKHKYWHVSFLIRQNVKITSKLFYDQLIINI